MDGRDDDGTRQGRADAEKPPIAMTSVKDAGEHVIAVAARCLLIDVLRAQTERGCGIDTVYCTVRRKGLNTNTLLHVESYGIQGGWGIARHDAFAGEGKSGTWATDE